MTVNKEETGKRIFNKGNAETAVKGLVIGATMLVPGVSGGTMAIILGIYDRLISSVSSFMKDKKGSLLFLMLFALSGLVGMFLFSKPLLKLINTFRLPMLYFFMGTVAGGIPLIFKRAEIKTLSFRCIFYTMLGIIVVAGVAAIPYVDAGTDIEIGFISVLILMAAGFIAAVALVLPGISVSYLFLVMGLYEELMRAISELYIPFLLPLGAGLIIGIIATTRILEKAMEKKPQPTYLIILGFVLGSMGELFPGIPYGIELPVCVIAMFVGFGCIIFLSRKEVL